MDNLHVCLLLVLSLALLFVRVARRSQGELPGPRPLPILGNVHQIPKTPLWLLFTDWSKIYGDIFQFASFGQKIAIICSADIATDLLEARGSLYSDRPAQIVAGELVGWNGTLGLTRYGERFREFRKIFHQYFGPRGVERLRPLQARECHRLLARLLDAPEDFVAHLRTMMGTTVLQVTHGYEASPKDDPYVKLAEETLEGFAKVMQPGRYIADAFPILAKLPNWFPGAGFLEEAAELRKPLQRLYDEPFAFVKAQLASGKVNNSLTAALLAEGRNEDLIKGSAVSVYTAGADTTVALLETYFMMMVMHPDVQAKAQAEIDSVIGTQRLPDFEDSWNLPYVTALAKELMRFNPPAPIGVPHVLMEDDAWRGYILKKGMVFYPNIWAMTRDERLYPEPFRFNPDRFVGAGGKTKQKDPAELIFGFGRRSCPGTLMAEQAIYITVATLLAVFNVSALPSAGGKIPELEFDLSQFLSHPKPFKCSIVPRSQQFEDLIRRSALEADQLEVHSIMEPVS